MRKISFKKGFDSLKEQIEKDSYSQIIKIVDFFLPGEQIDIRPVLSAWEFPEYSYKLEVEVIIYGASYLDYEIAECSVECKTELGDYIFKTKIRRPNWDNPSIQSFCKNYEQ